MVQSKNHMDDETIEGSPSEATPLEEETTPSEDTETEGAETGEAVETTETPAEEELFELPDGRKVDAAGVAQEYRNLLGDYTQKSQKLAELTRGTETVAADSSGA